MSNNNIRPLPLRNAYAHCMKMARSHYENFPVASVFLPKHLREPISVIYAFARTADDFADEGDALPAERLAQLNTYVNYLDMLKLGATVDNPIFIALDDVIKKHDLPLELFYDLLTAFSMDVTQRRYASQAEVLHYCRYSANPVGRLLLHLYKLATPTNLAQSDAVCSALQIINFLQDITQDYHEQGRIYFPQDDMARFGVTEEHIRTAHTDAAMRALMNHVIERTRQMMLFGAPLGNALPGRIGFELRMTIQGGLRILNALQRQHNDVFARPRLGVADWLKMIAYATFKKEK